MGVSNKCAVGDVSSGSKEGSITNVLLETTSSGSKEGSVTNALLETTSSGSK